MVDRAKACVVEPQQESKMPPRTCVGARLDDFQQRPRSFRRWSMEYGAWSMEYGVWSVEYGVWRFERGGMEQHDHFCTCNFYPTCPCGFRELWQAWAGWNQIWLYNVLTAGSAAVAINMKQVARNSFTSVHISWPAKLHWLRLHPTISELQ